MGNLWVGEAAEVGEEEEGREAAAEDQEGAEGLSVPHKILPAATNCSFVSLSWT